MSWFPLNSISVTRFIIGLFQGVHAIGLMFVPSSRRKIPLEKAREICEAVGQWKRERGYSNVEDEVDADNHISARKVERSDGQDWFHARWNDLEQRMAHFPLLV